MQSYANKDFWKCFDKLPQEVKEKARRDYTTWKDNPQHPGLVFKQTHPSRPIYSVRVGGRYRAMGFRSENSMTWFWIGSHEEYNILVHRRDI